MSATTQASWLQDAPSATGAASTHLAATLGAASGFSGADLIRTALALVLCLALGVGAIFIIRHRQRATQKGGCDSATRGIRVLDSARLNPRATLHLVEYGERTVLLCTDAGGIKLLDAHDVHQVTAEESIA